jgi:hypothetical protein
VKRRTYCTGFRSADDYNGCCRLHDQAYGIWGRRNLDDGSPVTRAQADRELRECVIANGMPRPFAWSAWLGLRAFGWAWWRAKV